jgi:chemotaxis signal transduction protein
MKYLTIGLANQICGIELDQVREWIGYQTFTPTTSADPAAVGCVDYRGRAIGVIDLRLRFDLPVTRTEWTSMVVVEVFGQTVALIVDNVLGMRDSAMPLRMNEKPFTAIDLVGCTTSPRRELKIAA